MERINSVEKFRTVINKKTNVIIYGAGAVGTVVIEQILRENPELSFFIAVSAKDGYPYYYIGGGYKTDFLYRKII